MVLQVFTAGGTQALPKELAELIARRFALLGEPTRVLLLDALNQRGEASVGELARVLGAGQANVSKHLGLLYAERIVGRERAGTSVRYRIIDEQVLELCDVVCGSIRDDLRQLSSIFERDPGRMARGSNSEPADAETTRPGR